MFEITESAINLDSLLAAVGDSSAGAIATFLGTTRASNRGRKVLRLEYEAYAEMAVSEFEKIAAEAARRYDKAQHDFVKSGKVEDQAGQAQPHDAAEAAELGKAEQAGKSHSKGEAPGDLRSGRKLHQSPRK